MLHFQQAASSDTNAIDEATHPDDNMDMEYIKMSKADASETNHHPIITMNDEELMEATLTQSNKPALLPNFEVAQQWDSAAITRIL